MTTHAAKPLPRITPDSEPFWQACRRHELALPHCQDCAHAFLPPAPVCPYCFGDGIEWRPATGRGVISTWTVVHKAWFDAFTADVPYNVVQVELEEGPRLTASVVGLPTDRLRVGLPVEVTFDDITAEMTLPRFRLRG